MKLGGFGRMNDFFCIQQAGFDYVELDVPELEALSEKEFSCFCDKVHESNFEILTGSRALPIAEAWFFTDRFCALEYKPYLKQACWRAKKLGMKKVIIGNGKARWLVDEISIKKEKRFIDFMRMFAEIAGENELEVILEPLGPKYSNYINTLPEAVRVIHEIGMPNVFTMADLRHLYWAKEPFTDLITCAEWVHHIHVDYPVSYPSRPFPSIEDDYDYTGFLDVLKESGYQDTLTIEADIPKDWKQAYINVTEVLQKVL